MKLRTFCLPTSPFAPVRFPDMNAHIKASMINAMVSMIRPIFVPIKNEEATGHRPRNINSPPTPITEITGRIIGIQSQSAVISPTFSASCVSVLVLVLVLPAFSFSLSVSGHEGKSCFRPFAC